MSTLVDEAVAAHGGAAVVAAGRGLRGTFRLRGNLLATRWRSPLTRPYVITVDTTRPHARLEPFHRPGRVAVFDGDRVALEQDGAILRERHGARAHAAARLVWDELDLAYFLGYALWNYVLTPYCFTWPGFATRELDAWRGLRRLQVTYPAGFPTHCATQTFYFDEATRLCRLDYAADVFNPRRLGAHLLEDHTVYAGLVVPRHRHVRLIAGDGAPIRWFPAAMEGWIDDLAVL